jgi:hypothetical protein
LVWCHFVEVYLNLKFLKFNLFYKVIGWGTENGIDYWLCKNSYGSNWGGLGGYFKIRRGTNECGCEQYLVCPIPYNPLIKSIVNDSYKIKYYLIFLILLIFNIFD